MKRADSTRGRRGDNQSITGSGKYSWSACRECGSCSARDLGSTTNPFFAKHELELDAVAIQERLFWFCVWHDRFSPFPRMRNGP